MAQNKNNNALIFIFITILIDVIGFGIIIPVFPKMLENLLGGGLSEAAQYGGWLMFVYAVMQFVFSPVLGGLSDAYGRRPVLLLSLLGFGVDYIFLAYAPNIEWLFVGRLIAGVTGASFTTASAYIADISKPEERAANFGLVGAAFGIGFIIGPVLGGVLSSIDLKAPFLAAAGLSFFNCLYGFFVLPESLSPENRRPFDLSRANPIGSLFHLNRYPVVVGLVLSLFCVYIAGHANQSTWSFITIEKFGWSETMVGYSLGMVGIMFALVQGGLIRVIVPWLGNKTSVYVGLVLNMIGFLGFAFATETWMVFAFIVPFALGAIGGPTLQGIISSQVPANEQGELQGGITSLLSISTIIGPLLMTYLFSYFTSSQAPIYFPAMPFLAAALLTLISIGMTFNTLRRI
jgi:MFS transporter, DHA1 family, tetracycline resistance protein